MLRMSLVSLVTLGLLSACGHTPQERAASGALIGATAGAIVGLASLPDKYESGRFDDRRYKRRHHDHDHRRYDRGYDDYRY